MSSSNGGLLGTRKPCRAIAIVMTDEMRFVPDRIRGVWARRSDSPTKIEARVMHEMVVGTPATLAEHAEMMRRFPEMEHDEPWMSHCRARWRGE